MIKVLFCLLLAILLFAGGAVGSWYLLQSQTSLLPGAASPAAPQSPAPADVSLRKAGSPTAAAAAAAAAPDDEELPVSVRSQPMTAEEVFRFGAAIRQRRELLQRREKAVEVEENRLRLMRDDLQEQQRAMDGMLVQIHDALGQAERLLQQIQEARSQWAADRQKAETELEAVQNSQSALNDTQRDNVKQVSRWFQSMPPEKAAEYLRELSNNGQLDSAVQLLGNLEEREAAKILVAMDDADLVVQLTEKFKNFKRPPKPARR